MSERLDGFALHHVCSPIDKLPRAKAAAGKLVSDEESPFPSSVSEMEGTQCEREDQELGQ